jgi:hypothetical protein
MAGLTGGIDVTPSKKITSSLGVGGVAPNYFGIGQKSVQPGAVQNTLPSNQNPFLTYGTVNNGRVVPPTNPTAPSSNFPTGGSAGTWESPGINQNPINVGPSQSAMSTMIPGQSPTNAQEYMNRGGFTGNTGMNQSVFNVPNYANPAQATIPNMNQNNPGALRNAYRSIY